jgi:predicted component of type VI protein secretion system
MTAPIDIECPGCASTAGNYCTLDTTDGRGRMRLTFYHAERIDAAFRANTQRQHNPRALRAALAEALARLEKHHPAVQDALNEEIRFILTTREEFGL